MTDHLIGLLSKLKMSFFGPYDVGEKTRTLSIALTNCLLARRLYIIAAQQLLYS